MIGDTTPKITLSTTRKIPSYMYGLYQSTSAMRSRNHAPQSLVLNASIRLTTGLATRTSSGHDTPDQKSIAKAKPTNTMPVPRSGCFMMSAHGIPTTTAGFHSSSSDRGGSLKPESTFASASTTVILASSDGCPMRMPPIASQLLELAAVPAPLPMNSSSTSIAIVTPYIGQVSQSINRTEKRVTAYAAPSEMRNHMDCVRHSLATAVTMSVWPAEYTMEMPYVDSSRPMMTSGQSTGKRRVAIIRSPTCPRPASRAGRPG